MFWSPSSTRPLTTTSPMLMLAMMRRSVLVIAWESKEGLSGVRTLLGYIARMARRMNELSECVEQ